METCRMYIAPLKHQTAACCFPVHPPQRRVPGSGSAFTSDSVADRRSLVSHPALLQATRRRPRAAWVRCAPAWGGRAGGRPRHLRRLLHSSSLFFTLLPSSLFFTDLPMHALPPPAMLQASTWPWVSSEPAPAARGGSPAACRRRRQMRRRRRLLPAAPACAQAVLDGFPFGCLPLPSELCWPLDRARPRPIGARRPSRAGQPPCVETQSAFGVFVRPPDPSRPMTIP